MSVKLPLAISAETKWYPIDLGAGQAFEIELRRPTFAEQVTSLAARDSAANMQAMLSTMVVGWRGVEDCADPPQPIGFSSDALLQLIQAYPQSFRQINSALMDVFYVYPEDLGKNLPTPPASGGTITTAETTASTESSNSGRSSDLESVSAENSAAS